MEKKMNEKRMTAKMLMFCEYYLDTRNATKSYSLAYSKPIETKEDKEKNYNSVSTSASKLLKDPRIKKYLESRMLELNFERDLTEKEIIMQLNKIALGSQFKENTRLEALKMLSRMKGMYDEVEKEQSINITLSADLESAMTEQRNVNPKRAELEELSNENESK